MHHFTQGKPTRQAHKGIPEGCYEEEQGLKGFFGPVSHLIKPRPSTRWVNIEGPLKPRMYDLAALNLYGDKSVRVLHNAAVCIYLQTATPTNSPRGTRNADGDTIYFCH